MLSGPQGQDALYQIAVNDVKPELTSLDGVASVNVNGGRARQVQVQLDPAKMAAFGVSLIAVQNALAGNDDVRNLVVSNTAIGQGSASAARLAGQNPGGLIYLRDIADVKDTYADQTSILCFNGVDTVSIGVVKTTDANTISVADAVKAKLADLNVILPPGARRSVMNGSSVYTKASVNAVEEDLILAVLITGLVMLVFLHTFRSMLIVLLAIPTSIIATFLLMWGMGFTLNTMTLLALTLIIGILVDDSIVVLEDTQRHLQMGKDSKQAALDGRSEIGLAAITITLVGRLV